MRYTITIKVIMCLLFVFIILPLLCSSSAHAGIVMRIVGVNPNETLTQTVELKTYLPEEVEPKDIIEKGDLEVVYDTQKGTYYVFGEYSLAPNESIIREIEIRDIWTVSAEELDGMRNDTARTVDLLSGTPFCERAIFIKEGIEEKLDDIARRQDVVDINPQKHIYNYRKNAEILESVKTDLILLKSMFGQSKPLPTGVIWKAFLAIAGFLSMVSLTLFLFWHKRLNAPAVAAIEDEPAPEEEEGAEESGTSEGGEAGGG